MKEWPQKAKVLKSALQSHKAGLDADFVTIKPRPLNLELKWANED